MKRAIIGAIGLIILGSMATGMKQDIPVESPEAPIFYYIIAENKLDTTEEMKDLKKIEPSEYRTVRMTVTAYAPHDNKSGICNDGDPTKTSTGTYPDWGTVAVNPETIPYGTRLYIPGYGEGVALDTGGAMRRNPNKIDLYFDTYEQAMEWGVKELEVIIYKGAEI